VINKHDNDCLRVMSSWGLCCKNI